METTSNGFERNASGCPFNPQGHYFQINQRRVLVSKIVSLIESRFPSYHFYGQKIEKPCKGLGFKIINLEKEDGGILPRVRGAQLMVPER